jgi:hypothetical protein
VASLIGLYRSRPQIVQAYQDDAGQIRIIGRNGTGLSLEEFQTQFEPARPEDLVTPAATNGHTPATQREPSKAQKTPRKPVTRPGSKPGAGPRAVPQDLVHFAERLWVEGKKASEIAKAVTAKGRPVTDQTIYNWSAKHTWKRGARPVNGRPKGRKTGPAKTEDAEISQMSRVCDNCEQRVKGDPCPVCGKPR